MHPLDKDICTLIKSRFLEEKLKKMFSNFSGAFSPSCARARKNGTIDLSEVKFITKEQHEKISRFQIYKDEIVIAIAGTVGKLAIVPEEMGISNVTENLAIIVPNDDITLLYMYYMLNSSIVQIQIQKEMSELRQQKLGLGKVRRLKIPKPPIEEIQNKIKTEIEDEINKNEIRRKLIDTLLHKAIMLVEQKIQ